MPRSWAAPPPGPPTPPPAGRTRRRTSGPRPAAAGPGRGGSLGPARRPGAPAPRSGLGSRSALARLACQRPRQLRWLRPLQRIRELLERLGCGGASAVYVVDRERGDAHLLGQPQRRPAAQATLAVQPFQIDGQPIGRVDRTAVFGTIRAVWQHYCRVYTIPTKSTKSGSKPAAPTPDRLSVQWKMA